MLDYLKIWVFDSKQIDQILNNPQVRTQFISNEEGELVCRQGDLGIWKFKTLSPRCLEIAGSIHKYWNGGTNENDFAFLNVVEAINNFCVEFDINPSLAFVKNLEFGLNLQLSINASHLIENIIAYNYLLPIQSYKKKPDFYFIEFKSTEYYLKVYDKGKQYKSIKPEITNTLRIEVKAMKNRLLPEIKTLSDLQQFSTLHQLGMKFVTLFKRLVFVDDGIALKELNRKERELYEELANPRKWQKFKGNVTSGIRKRIKKFKDIVENKGPDKIYSTLTKAINDKLQLLSRN